MAKFAQFTAPDKTLVYIDPKAVVRIYPRINGPGSCLNLSNGLHQDVLEVMHEVLNDLEAWKA